MSFMQSAWLLRFYCVSSEWLVPVCRRRRHCSSSTCVFWWGYRIFRKNSPECCSCLWSSSAPRGVWAACSAAAPLRRGSCPEWGRRRSWWAQSCCSGLWPRIGGAGWTSCRCKTRRWKQRGREQADNSAHLTFRDGITINGKLPKKKESSLTERPVQLELVGTSKILLHQKPTGHTHKQWLPLSVLI